MNRKLLRVEWAVEEISKLGDCYFLTFTTPDVVTCRELSQRWRSLCMSFYWKQIYNKTSGNKYLMVFEKHTKGHGWHVHMITNFRHDVNLLRHVTTSYGFGRINALFCGRHLSALGKYLGKYVSKQFHNRDPETKGIRLCNVSRGLCTLSRIEVSSPRIEYIRYALWWFKDPPRRVRFQLFKYFGFCYDCDFDSTLCRLFFAGSRLPSYGFSFFLPTAILPA